MKKIICLIVTGILILICGCQKDSNDFHWIAITDNQIMIPQFDVAYSPSNDYFILRDELLSYAADSSLDAYSSGEQVIINGKSVDTKNTVMAENMDSNQIITFRVAHDANGMTLDQYAATYASDDTLDVVSYTQSGVKICGNPAARIDLVQTYYDDNNDEHTYYNVMYVALDGDWRLVINCSSLDKMPEEAINELLENDIINQ